MHKGCPVICFLKTIKNLAIEVLVVKSFSIYSDYGLTPMTFSWLRNRCQQFSSKILLIIYISCIIMYLHLDDAPRISKLNDFVRHIFGPPTLINLHFFSVKWNKHKNKREKYCQSNCGELLLRKYKSSLQRFHENKTVSLKTFWGKLQG